MIMKQQLSIGITAATVLCMLASFYHESIATHAFITQPPHHNIATTILSPTAIDMSSRRGDPYYSQTDYPWENDNDDVPLDYYPQPPPYRYDTTPPPYREQPPPPFQNNNDNYNTQQRPPQQQYQRPTTRSDNTPSRFQGTAEDFRRGGSPASPLFNISRQQQQKQIPSMQNVNNIYDQQQRYNDYNQPPMQQRGFNVGETYTEDFRNGGTSNNRRPTRQTQPPPTKTPRTRQSSQQHGTNFVKQRLEQYQSNYMDRDRQQDDQDIRRQSSFNNDEQFSYFDGIEDDWGSRSDDRIPNSSYQRRGDDSYDMPRPPPMNDYEDVDEYRTIERDRYDEPVRQPQPRYESRYDSARSNTRLSNQYQPPPPPVSRDDNMMRNEDTERIYDQWQQERYQAENEQQQRQRQYDEESNTRSRKSTRPRYSPNTSTKGYGPGNSFRPQTGYQRGNPRRQVTQPPPYYPYGPSSRSSNGNGNGIMGMFDRLMNPYSTFSPSIMMGRLSNAMAKSTAQEEQSNKYLLSDASKILSNDVAVKNMLGPSIELGTPFSKTSSSSMVNGVTKSRLELVIPVSGKQNTGRIRLIANQDGIMQMELDVGGRIINVPLDNNRQRYGDAIDADIEDRDYSL